MLNTLKPLRNTLALLLFGCCYTGAVSAATATQDAATNDSISRVEHGLSSLVVAKGASAQKMNLVDRMQYYRVPAVSIAVVNNGRIEWARAYGVNIAGKDGANDAQSTTPTTLFQAASISKSLTALAALHLVEQGKLQLDGDINNQLHSWKLPDNEFTKEHKVSLRQLLNHSGGINVHGFKGYADGQPLPDLLAVLNGVAPSNTDAIRVEAVPGNQWSYSGGGYTIAQLMMIEASKQDFPQLLQQILFSPFRYAAQFLRKNLTNRSTQQCRSRT